jgi:hypothetical protein
MSTQHPGPTGRRVALAGILAALAIAAPAGEANAATPFTASPRAAFVYGGTAIGDVFNGGTTVVVSTGAAVGTTAYSP